MCSFGFDVTKSLVNLEKHGTDFVDAQKLWADPDLVEVQARSTDEPRSLVIGSIEDKVWSAVNTYRGEVIRIISMRRSRKSEIALYES
jgi:uncharacterized DUF497 family protein